MNEAIIVSSFVAFFSTTVDDFAVMLVFFSQANKMENVVAGYGEVILGQVMAFSIVVLISLIGLILGIFVPSKYIDLVGFIPLVMGLMKAHEVVQENGWCGYPKPNKDNAEGEDIITTENPIFPALTNGNYAAVAKEDISIYGSFGSLEFASVNRVVDEGKKNEIRNDEIIGTVSNMVDKKGDIEIGSSFDDIKVATTEYAPRTETDGEQQSNPLAGAFKHICVHCLDPFVLEVMIFGLACSSDNIAIYTSIFASVSPLQAVFVIVLFYLLLLSNIAVAILLMQCKSVAKCFDENSKYLVPLLLMGLGIDILSQSVIWPGNR